MLVVLFWNSGSSDDRAVREDVQALDRRGGKVAVAIAPVQQVGRFEPITAGVQITQSPTVLVVDTRTREATALAGFSDQREIDQAVQDTLAA